MNSTAPGDPTKGTELTRDQFLGGRIIVTQPKNGFRAGLDGVLLAASVRPRSRSLLDLGAGVGTVSLCALADLPQLEATLIENQPDIARLAEGKVGAQYWSVYVPASLDEPEAVQMTIEQIDVTKRLVERYPDDLALALKART